MNSEKPINAKNIAKTPNISAYPEPFLSMMKGRAKRKLGNHFGLVNFGVNLTELEPGSMSSLKHHHKKQDEFIYILSGTPTLYYGDNQYLMNPGDCFGFQKDNGVGHHLVNNSDDFVAYLEIGDRIPQETVEYPDDDLYGESVDAGTWIFQHKDGSPY